MPVIDTAARPLLASVFVYGGLDTLRDPEPRAKLAGPLIDRVSDAVPALPADRVALVRANAAVQVAAGTLLTAGRLPRLAALALAGSLVPTTIAGHRFWELDDPPQAAQHRTHFLKNTAVLGGLLLAAARTRRRR